MEKEGGWQKSPPTRAAEKVPGHLLSGLDRSKSVSLMYYLHSQLDYVKTVWYVTWGGGKRWMGGLRVRRAFGRCFKD